VKKRVVFMGGKKPGEACLEILRRHPDVELVGNVGNMNGGVWNFTGQIRQLKPDLIIVVYYDYILSPEIIAIPPMGCINLHLALAEEYRGCYPTTWAIINGETRTGVTLHYIDEGIDTGDIIAQTEVPIYPQDTGKDLYERCTRAGVALFESELQSILDGTNDRRPQSSTRRTLSYRRIFPSHEVTDMYHHGKNYIRALYFPPWPKPYVDIGGRKFYLVEEGDMPDD